MPYLSPIGQLLKKAVEYEEKARAIRIAVAELNGHATSQAVAALPAKLASAIKLTKNGKRIGRPPGTQRVPLRQTYDDPGRPRPKKHYTTEATAKRKKTAAILAAIGEKGGEGVPFAKYGRRLSPLIRRGYIEKAGDVYVRTAKEFIV